MSSTLQLSKKQAERIVQMLRTIAQQIQRRCQVNCKATAQHLQSNCKAIAKQLLNPCANKCTNNSSRVEISAFTFHGADKSFKEHKESKYRSAQSTSFSLKQFLTCCLQHQDFAKYLSNNCSCFANKIKLLPNYCKTNCANTGFCMIFSTPSCRGFGKC